MEPIAHIETDFPSKFGLPRQSGLCEELTGRIVFEPKYRRREAFRGLSDFSHIWVIWKFSETERDEWSPTVRPPRLGGNTRMGVFATRSPFRPNPIGLSCVRLVGIDYECENAPVLLVTGIDMMDGTPVFDIKPYIPTADCKPQASDGFTAQTKDYRIAVDFPQELLDKLPEDKREAAVEMLALDPRPSYIEDDDRLYGVAFAGFNIRFTVKNGTLTVTEIQKLMGNFN